MLRRLVHSRARHFLILLPMGIVAGILTGIAFHDILFGFLAGLILGAAFAGLLTLQSR